MSEVEFFVPAMHCAHCVHTIKMELRELDGVQAVEVDLTNKKVRVKYEAPASPESVAKLLEEINYPPQGI